MNRLAGKVAIVTGAGSIGPGIGNGKAASVLFAREGANLLLVDKHAESLEITASLAAAEGATVRSVVADVSLNSGCETIREACLEHFGRVDVLHNNVGIEIPGGLEATSEEDWDATMRVNLKSMFLLCRQILPRMAAQRSGSVLNISSINAVRTLPALSLAYGVSKAGVIAFTRELAIEYAPSNVRVNAILPGAMATPFATASLSAAYGGDHDEMMRLRDNLSPMGQQGEAWDVANLAVFLASEEAKYVTAAAMVVDGGQSARLSADK